MLSAASADGRGNAAGILGKRGEGRNGAFGFLVAHGTFGVLIASADRAQQVELVIAFRAAVFVDRHFLFLNINGKTCLGFRQV